MGKILVTVDDKLLARIDKAARAVGMTRSAYLSRLAERDVHESRGPGRMATSRRALGHLDELFVSAGTEPEVTRTVREERDAR